METNDLIFQVKFKSDQTYIFLETLILNKFI